MPNNSLLLSILVLCHNDAVFLRRSLRSILAQNLSIPVEVILLDDGSTDDSVMIAEAEMASAAQSGFEFRIIRHQTNMGNAAAFVTALGAARGKYYHVLDADDYWIDPDKLATQIAILEADRSLAGVGHRTITRNLRDGSETFVPQQEPAKAVLAFEDFLLGGWYFHTSAMMLRNPCVDAPGQSGPVPAVPVPAVPVPAIFRDVRGDTVRLLVAASQGGIHYLPQTMSVYDDHGAGIWTGLDAAGKEALLRNLLNRLQQHGYLAPLGETAEAFVATQQAELGGYLPTTLRPLAILPELPAGALPRRLTHVNRMTCLRDLELQVERCLADGRIEDGLNLLSRFVSAFDHDRTLSRLAQRHRFSSPEIDCLAQALGQALGARMGILPSPESALARSEGPTVIVVSGLEDGQRGATLVELSALLRRQGAVVILSTNVQGSDPASTTAAAIRTAGVVVLQNDEATLEAKAAWVMYHAARLRPARVIALPAAQDMAIAAGLRRELAPEVYLLDTADHGYGPCRHSAAIGTVILRRPSDLAYIHAIEPGKSLALLPHTLSPQFPDQPASWARGGTVTAMACEINATIELVYDFPYDDIIAQMLNAGVSRHVHIGPLSQGQLHRIRKTLARSNIDEARFRHLPTCVDFADTVAAEGVHVLLQGFPIPEAAQVVKAMSVGLPVILHQSYWHPMLCLSDMTYPGAAVWHDPASLADIVRNIDASWLDDQRRRCQEFCTLRTHARAAMSALFQPVTPAFFPRFPVPETPQDLRRALNDLTDLTIFTP